MADIILRVVFEGSTYDLDIEGDVPLRLDVSAVENDRIGSFFGVGSQTFDLPGTKTNNRFFKHAYEMGASDIPAFYNTIQAYVIYNGETLLEGQLLLLEAITDQDGFVVYKVQLSDTVVQFKDSIANKLIRDGDWSAYDHTLDSGSIIDSWSDNLLGGSVFYPLADFGANSSKDWPAVPRVAQGTTDGFIGSPNTPMQAQQFLPAIKVKDTLDVIFDQVGFSYTGSFVSGSSFDNLYILPKAKDTLGAGEPVFNGIESQAASTVPTMTSTVAYPVNFTSVTDPGNNFNIATDTYTVPADGDYGMSANFSFIANPVTPANSPVDFMLTFAINGTPSGDSASQILSTGQFPSPMAIPAQTFTLNAGDTIQLTLTAFFNGTSVNSFPCSAGWVIPNSSAPTSYEGVNVDMALQWDAQTKSLDILKGLIDQFNLVLTPVYRENAKISIDTFDVWMSQGSTVDWTDKFETAIRTGIRHTVSEQQRELRLANVDDNDRFSRLAIEDTPNFQYGTARLLSDNNISQGEKRIGSLFAPTVLGSEILSGSVDQENNPTFNLNFASTFVFPHLYKFDNRAQKSFKFKPRIGYKVSNALPSPIYIGSQLASTEVIGSYSTISNLSQIPAVTGVTDDLHFNNTYAPFVPGNINAGQGKTAYETYWKTYIDSLYWQDSRKLTIDIQFNKEEYKNIRLNDIIFIKDQQYRINKISGFNISSNDIATVELIRLYPAYYQGATPYVPPTTTTSTSTTTSTTTAPTTTTTTSTSTSTSTTTLPTTTSTTTSTTTLPTTTTSTSTTTSTTTLPTTTSTSTTTSTTTLACNCITVDVLNGQLTSGGLDLYYIVNNCGGGSRDVNLATSLGIEQGGSTYFGICSRATSSNIFKYGPSGSPFVGLPGMNVNPNGTICTIDTECSPVLPTTTTSTTTSTTTLPTTTSTSTSTTTSTTTLPTTTSTSTTTSTTTIDPYTYYFATACDGTPGTVYFRSITAYTPGESVQIDTFGTVCYEVGASGAPINANNVINAYPDCIACNPPTTTSTSTTTSTTTLANQSFIAERFDGGVYAYLGPLAGYSTNDLVTADDGSGQCWTLGAETTVAIDHTITGTCPPPTTTSTTTTTTTLGACTQWFGSAGFSTSAQACSNAGFGTRRRHNGATAWPEIGDTVFTEATCTTTLTGLNLWYYVDGDTAAIEINDFGVVVSKVYC